MPKLILHSDDFGLHEAINRAILDAAAKGVLTNASLMVNGIAAKEAIAGALRHPSLVSRHGRFLNSAGQLLARSALGKISPRHVYLEYRRQVLYMIGHDILMGENISCSPPLWEGLSCPLLIRMALIASLSFC